MPPVIFVNHLPSVAGHFPARGHTGTRPKCHGIMCSDNGPAYVSIATNGLWRWRSNLQQPNRLRSSPMEPRRSIWTRLLFTATFVTLASVPLAAEVLDKTEKIAGTTMHYKVILPNGFNPAKTYPAVLAFPGGPQTMDTVDGTV